MKTTEHLDLVASHNGHTCQLDDGLISNWPPFDGFEGREERPDRWKYFIDSKTTGLTIGEAPDLGAANRLAAAINGVVRSFLLTEDIIHDYNESQRELKRLGVV